jgi:hypothetical protein
MIFVTAIVVASSALINKNVTQSGHSIALISIVVEFVPLVTRGDTQRTSASAYTCTTI